MDTQEINTRYTLLAQDTCCLSCGGALEKGDARLGEVCIDLGSGRGTDVLRLAELTGDTGFVYGIDVTDEMITKAELTAAKMGVKNVKFIKADLEAIPLPNETADLIISNCTLNHVENKQMAWLEIYRLLKTDGRFVISDIYSDQPVPVEYSSDPIAVAECWGGSITKDEYMNIIHSVGFKNVEILEESQPYDKGKIKVSSFTITAEKKSKCCCCE